MNERKPLEAMERLLLVGESLDRMSTQLRKGTYALAAGDINRALYELRGAMIEHNGNILSLEMAHELLEALDGKRHARQGRAVRVADVLGKITPP